MVVAGMAAHTDINRAHEVANEVRRIHKQLKEAQVLAQTYNNRERLFGMPITDVCIVYVVLSYDEIHIVMYTTNIHEHVLACCSLKQLQLIHKVQPGLCSLSVINWTLIFPTHNKLVLVVVYLSI